MKLSLDEVIAATGGAPHALEPETAPAAIITDTRTIAPGDAFLALRGERFDGHAFVDDALARGAAYAIVSDPSVLAAGAPAVVVDDTLRAYMALAAQARSALTIPLVALTGSAGKTTTKELLVQLLRAAGMRVAATPANENNEIGVSKFLLARVAGDADVAVVEMGARKYGDISVLVGVAHPTLGVLTNVGEAHLEIMGTRERIAETKWGLFDDDAHAVLNLDDEVSRRRAPHLAHPPRWFGTGDADAPGAPGAEIVRDASSVTIVRDAHRCTIVDDGHARDLAIDVPFPGAYNLANLAAAFAAARTFVPAERLAPHVAGLELPAGRYERHEHDGVTFVYDAYNAPPSGTIYAFETFAQERARRRIVVFGGMAELGDASHELHVRAGAAAAAVPDVILLAGGDFAGATVEGAREAGLDDEKIVRYRDNGEATAWLRAHAARGDAVLFKGARRYAMEEIRDALLGSVV